ncbi:FAD-dependent oxidoreductase [Nonomuraea insulae]|uniref:FAD-dependent oxidoreductase n=1 Tax=Nonomuraea insulae TaxID=1616787 RepID=A0ABW1CFC9_9ACTN
MDADVIVIGAGLVGLVAAHELTAAGRKVILVDQENAANLGGQAFWSFGGLFLVGTPEQRLDPAAGPLIAVRLNILTRKSLGGIQTDLDSRALGQDGLPIDGLYAAREVAGFGGGGVHGYGALEGTFLGGCVFSGRAAGRAAARETA